MMLPEASDESFIGNDCRDTDDSILTLAQIHMSTPTIHSITDSFVRKNLNPQMQYMKMRMLVLKSNNV